MMTRFARRFALSTLFGGHVLPGQTEGPEGVLIETAAQEAPPVLRANFLDRFVERREEARTVAGGHRRRAAGVPGPSPAVRQQLAIGHRHADRAVVKGTPVLPITSAPTEAAIGERDVGGDHDSPGPARSAIQSSAASNLSLTTTTSIRGSSAP